MVAAAKVFISFPSLAYDVSPFGTNRFHSMAYAEDELSDDECSDGSPRSNDRTTDGAAPAQKLYEEDELSDDDDSNQF